MLRKILMILFYLAGAVCILLGFFALNSDDFNGYLLLCWLFVIPLFAIGALFDDSMRESSSYSRTSKSTKPASVIKRGVAGTIIGGIPGAIIGAASAIDKNNRNHK